jgi:serine/threonine protein kinase
MNNTVEHYNALPIDFQLEDYKIQSLLGEGHFGLTYLAQDTQDKTLVAIKEYFPNQLVKRDQTDYTLQPKSLELTEDFVWGLRQFVQEAERLAQLEHPNIVRVLRVFEAFNTAYFVMEYELGRNLGEVMASQNMTEEQLISFVRPLLEGMETIHQAGYLHQDIKPANIYIRDKDNTPVLIDFGAARYELGSHSGCLTTRGTIGYTPYEQFDGSQQGAWTDIYSLGAVLYQLISAQAPPEATDRLAAIMHNKTDPLKPAVKIGEGRYAHSLLEAIDWALQLNELNRPQSIKALRDKLLFNTSLKLEEPSMSSIETDEMQSSPPRSWLGPFAIGVGITLLLVILAVGGFLFYQDQAQPDAGAEKALDEGNNTTVLAGFDNHTTSVGQNPDMTGNRSPEGDTSPVVPQLKPSASAAQLAQFEQQARENAQARSEAAKAQLPSGTLRIMSAAGVRLRQAPRHRAGKGSMLQIGTIVVELDTTVEGEQQWYRVQHPDNNEEGWVYGAYTLPLNASQRGQTYIQVAQNKLNNRQTSFGDLVDLCHFLSKVHTSVELEQAVELQLLYLVALQQSLDKIPTTQQDDPRYAAWINQSEADIVYKESKGGWVVKKERFQQLHDQYRFLPIAQRILREAP